MDHIHSCCKCTELFHLGGAKVIFHLKLKSHEFPLPSPLDQQKQKMPLPVSEIERIIKK